MNPIMLNCDVCGGDAQGENGSFVELIEEVEGLGVTHETYWMCASCKQKHGQADG